MSVVRVIRKFSLILSKHQKFRLFELAIMMIVGGLLEMCSVSLIVPFMNVAMEPEATMEKWYAEMICTLFNVSSPKEFLLIVSILLSALFILKNAYLLFNMSMQYHFVYGNMLQMQRRILNDYIYRPYEFFLKVSSGEVIRILNNDTSDAFFLLTNLLNLFTELIVSTMLIVAVFIISPFVTICMALMMFFLVLIISSVIKPILQRAGKVSQKSSSGMNKWLLQSIQGIKEVKVLGREEYFKGNFDKYGYDYVNALRKYQVLQVTPRFFIEGICMAVVFIIIAVMINMGTSLESIVPIISAVAMAAMRLLPSINRMSTSLANIAYNETKLDKLLENLSDVGGEAKPKKLESREQKKPINEFSDEIKLEKISYHYPNAEKNVLFEAELNIKKGESIGIVGASGAGKTTTIDILLGLLSPQKGKILIDRHDIYDDLNGWHSQLGYIPQMIFMLDDTIRSNICFGARDEEISDERIWNALKDASLDEFVRSLPEGLDTEIGERGVRLSGGQRQRIGIARALYLNPNILVFDEATSALDTDTETSIMESIHKLHGTKTMIIIAHRRTTLESCDHIYKVENGKIVMER